MGFVMFLTRPFLYQKRNVSLIKGVLEAPDQYLCGQFEQYNNITLNAAVSVD